MRASLRRTRRYRRIKRLLDVVFSSILLFFLALPMIGIAVAVACSSRGGAIFRQLRVGRGGKVFTCYKFRTMYADAPHDCPTASLRDAERWITPIGKFLRQTSLDELPQLINVLRGEMSLVGPRPLIPAEREVHEWRRRGGVDTVRPGMTGLAQINGRDRLEDREKARFDVRYAHRLGFWEDARIVRKTFSRLLRGADRRAVR